MSLYHREYVVLFLDSKDAKHVRAIATIMIKSANNNDTNDKYIFMYVFYVCLLYIHTPLQEFFVESYI